MSVFHFRQTHFLFVTLVSNRTNFKHLTPAQLYPYRFVEHCFQSNELLKCTVSTDMGDTLTHGKFLKKGPPIGKDGVSKKNSDFLGEKTNRKLEKNINYIDYYSVKFRRTTSGSMTFCSQEGALQHNTLHAPAPPTSPQP